VALHQQSVASFRAELEEARRGGVVDLCLAAEGKAGLPRAVLLAIASRETHCRDIVGDGGHGRGLFQVDDRSHAAFLRRHGVGGPGGIPPVAAAADYAGQLLKDNLAFGRGKGLAGDALLKFALSAYNAGAGGAWRSLQERGDSDARTAHGNYARDVLERMRLARAWLDGAAIEGDEPVLPVLRSGSRGREVLELKRLLRAWSEANPGVRLPWFLMNGAFGRGTRGAVEAFQRAAGLEVDGVVGKDTWGALLRRRPPADL
jgi:peptidoglycan hydrolase-like protein with peptidoglycan-binding domain